MLCFSALALSASALAPSAHASTVETKHRQVSLLRPCSIAFDRHGNMFICETHTGYIVEMTSAMKLKRTWAKRGKGPGQFGMGISELAIDAKGNVYATDPINNRLQKFSSRGKLEEIWPCPPKPIKHVRCTGYTGGPYFDFPFGIAIGRSGTVYVADSGNKHVETFDQHGHPESLVGNTSYLSLPFIVAVDAKENLYVVDSYDGHVEIYDAQNRELADWPAVEPDEATPIALGSGGSVYIADTDHNRILHFSHDGSLLSSWGQDPSSSLRFDHPLSIALDSHGRIWVGEWGGLLELSTSGNVLRTVKKVTT